MLYNTETKKFNVETESFVSKYEDTSLHDADEIFMATMRLGKRMIKDSGIDLISLSGTWHSLVLCDEGMNPVTPVYQWSNTEASETCRALRRDKEFVDRYYNRTGCMVNAIYPSFKLMMLKKKGYDIGRYLISGQGDYNFYRLTKVRATMDSMASGTGLLNIRERKYDQEILESIGITEDQLARIVTYRETFPLSEEGAEVLGVTPGIPVMTTGPDGGLNQIGAGATAHGVMTFSVGTSGALRLSTDSPVIPETPSTWCYLSPKSWLSGAATSGCTNCIDWYKESMFSADTTYAEIEQGINKAVEPPIFLPFLYGERSPGWKDQRTARFCGIRPYHSKYEAYNGVLQGVLFNLYQNYLILEKLNGKPKKIMLSGGILNSPYWTQMCADIFNAEMVINEVEHSSLLGGVALGMEILGVVEDSKDFQLMDEKRIIPDKEKHHIYRGIYSKYEKYYNES
jgi:gluconokinase